MIFHIDFVVIPDLEGVKFRARFCTFFWFGLTGRSHMPSPGLSCALKRKTSGLSLTDFNHNKVA